MIFGLGTGRCGTMSLAAFLNSCKNSFITHEGRSIGAKIAADRSLLPWEVDVLLLNKSLGQILNREPPVVGDVAFYYLPYVELILDEYPNSKFVCMKRSKGKTIGSYMVKTKNRNHWQNWSPGCDWNKDSAWDPCYPKFAAKNKKESLSMYWDKYYLESKRLSVCYPDNFAIFNVNQLNSKNGLLKIKKFVGTSCMSVVPKRFFNTGVEI